MPSRKILFAADFSRSSDDALPVAASLACNRGATLLIAHVSELERRPVGELFDDMPDLAQAPAPQPIT